MTARQNGVVKWLSATGAILAAAVVAGVYNEIHDSASAEELRVEMEARIAADKEIRVQVIKIAEQVVVIDKLVTKLDVLVDRLEKEGLKK